MKKSTTRILASLLAVILLIGILAPGTNQHNAYGFAYANAANLDRKSQVSNTLGDSEQAEIVEKVEEYLGDCVYAIYFYDSRNTKDCTILNENVIGSELESLTQLYGSDMSCISIAALEDISTVATRGTSALFANLMFQEDRIEYFAHLYETQSITYRYFNASYDVKNITANGEAAFVQV